MASLLTPMLNVAYETGGPVDGRKVLLLHGWPDDASGWTKVAAKLESAGYRWLAPMLRGFGATRFRDAGAVRDGSSVALVQDAIDVADGMNWSTFAVVGHDWGGRAAYHLAALFPERVMAIAALGIGYSPRGEFNTPSFEQSRRWWYQWLMATDGGAASVRADPIGFARIQWDTWSPEGWFDAAEFDATAKSFLNPDWNDITLHGYRSRWKQEAMDPQYDPLRARLKAVTDLGTPTLFIAGGADRCNPPSEADNDSRYFKGGYERVVIDGAGHFPAREAPDAVAAAVVRFFSGHEKK